MDTRIDLSSSEQKWLKAIAPDYRTLIKQIAAFLEVHRSKIGLLPPELVRSTHMSIDEEDWDTIKDWIARYGTQSVYDPKQKKNIVVRRITAKQLILHVATLIDRPEYDEPRRGQMLPHSTTLRDLRNLRYRLRKANINLRRYGSDRPETNPNRSGLSQDYISIQEERKQLIAAIKRISTSGIPTLGHPPGGPADPSGSANAGM